MTEIEWADPPPINSTSVGAPIKYRVEADAARANPGRWLVLPASSSNYIAPVCVGNGHLRAFRPAGEFEAVSRMVDGVRRTYVHYIGPTGTPDGDA